MTPECRFQYVYEPMEFNFSRMCNRGAALAKGDYILFLNDDIEIIQEDWLEKMVEKARLPHVGAVGVKLLYLPAAPFSTRASPTSGWVRPISCSTGTTGRIIIFSGTALPSMCWA